MKVITMLTATLLSVGAAATSTQALPQAPPTSVERAAPGPVVVDNFTSLRQWSVYHGDSSLSEQGVRLRQNVELIHWKRTFARVSVQPVHRTTSVGRTTLHAGEYAAGGMSLRVGHRTYGHWRMDLRMSRTQRGVRSVALMWPEGRWPAAGEIDFVENGADLPPSTGKTVIANHYANASGGNAQQIKTVSVNFTTWVSVKIDWSPGLLVISFNGRVVFRTTAHVPRGPMFLCLQTAVAGGGKAARWEGNPRSPGFIDIDNLRVFAP